MRTVIFLILACASCLASVSKAQDPNPNITELTGLSLDFAMNLYRRIAGYHDNNIIFSPLCVSSAFAALSMGTGGLTREQIIRGLNLTPLEREGQPLLIPDLFRQLLVNVSQDGELHLAQSTAFFVHLNFHVKKTFSDQLKRFLDADINNVDFSNTHSSMDTINEYIRSKTGDKVKAVVSDIDPLTQLMLVNTIFFQGKWEQPFDASATVNDRFYVDKYNVVQVPMMFQEDRFYTTRDQALKLNLLKLPYLGGSAMLILLPDKSEDYTTVDDLITAKRLLGWVKQLKRMKLEVHLPRFRMEQSYAMHKILPDLGITNVFADNANVSGLTTQPGLKVSEVLHKTVIEVDEKGTTAAAATTTGITAYSLPSRFLVNRPFFFFIYHEATGSLLFMGRVIDPTKL